ncbi:MAG: Do family serine endopeptidase, partial [Gammaproteobacteria bacterium]|nr:Do family serine endopeptidase [Gammaproteobacteria bacterium]
MVRSNPARSHARRLAALLVWVVSTSPSFGALPSGVPTLAPMLERVTPAVVNIATRGKVVVRQRGLFDSPLFNDPFFQRFFDYPQQPRERETRSLGSGVIVDAQRGYLLTNHHVIEGAQTITVTLSDGRELDGELLGSDPKSDIAVVKIFAQGLVALPKGDSEQLRVGDFVVAIGNPFGLGQTVTSGIVSALGRSGLGIEDFEDFIQTDASINPGNSGGALVSLDGRLVGINTAILGPNGGNIGIGFAIPSNMAVQIMEQLVAHGEVRRGRLGVSVQEMTPELARAFNLDSVSGVVISRVEIDSPAQRAGLRPGDVVLELDGRRIRDSEAMRNAIGLLRVGQTISIRIVRDREERTLQATLEETAGAQAEGGDYSRHLRGALLS